ncbi:MAG TPA: hypothetical protein ENF23_04115 [Methanosarcinales archaeon]|nr:hypothetical protein [Methanosarcinales archaeon]
MRNWVCFGGSNGSGFGLELVFGFSVFGGDDELVPLKELTEGRDTVLAGISKPAFEARCAGCCEDPGM